MSLVNEKESSLSNGLSNKIVLVSANGDKNNKGFIYNLEILPATLSVQDHHSKVYNVSFFFFLFFYFLFFFSF